MIAFDRQSAGTRPPATPLHVHLVGASSGRAGISRYCDELRTRLAGCVEYAICNVSAGLLASVPLFRQLPLRIDGLRAGGIVHFPQVVGVGTAWFRRLPPSVVTVHDLGMLVWPEERKLFSPAAQVLLHLAFTAIRRMDRVIADSKFTARSLTDRLGIPQERITVVPLGVDHTVFRLREEARRLAEERLGIGGWAGTKTMLTVGTELPRKNIGLLLKMLARLTQRGEPVRLFKVGGAGGAPWRAATLAEAQRLGVAERLHIIEGLADEDLALLYSAADVYVTASWLEGFSLPTLEALACGTPVVVAPSGALPEVVGDGGIVVTQPELAEFVAALDAIFAGGTLVARLREAAVRQAARFDWQATAAATYDVYSALASGCGR